MKERKKYIHAVATLHIWSDFALSTFFSKNAKFVVVKGQIYAVTAPSRHKNKYA